MNRFSKMSLIALALGAFAFLHGCYSPSVDLPQSTVAYIYENAAVKKTVRFPAETPAPTELQEWVKFNNGTWYRPTIPTMYQNMSSTSRISLEDSPSTQNLYKLALLFVI